MFTTFGPNKCGYSENAYVNIHDTRIHLYIFLGKHDKRYVENKRRNVVVDVRPKYVCEMTDRRGRRLLKKPNSTLPSAVTFHSKNK